MTGKSQSKPGVLNNVRIVEEAIEVQLGKEYLIDDNRFKQNDCIYNERISQRKTHTESAFKFAFLVVQFLKLDIPKVTI